MQDPAKIETGPNVGAYYFEQFGTNFVNSAGRGCAACGARLSRLALCACPVCARHDGATTHPLPIHAVPHSCCPLLLPVVIITRQFINESDFQPTSAFYSLDIPGAAHIVSLNSYLPWSKGSAQYKWLLQDLAKGELKGGWSPHLGPSLTWGRGWW